VIVSEASEEGNPAAATFFAPGARRLEVGASLGVNGAVAVSADGTRAAFASAIEGSIEIGAFPDALAGDIAGVDASVAGAGRPSWSPDGRRIVFADRDRGDWNLYTVPAAAADSAEPMKLGLDTLAAERNPRWSPDGRSIAFETNRDGNWEIYVSTADGSVVRNLTRDPSADTLGDWSPDSQLLVFSSTRAGDADLYTIGVNGGAATRVTSAAGAETHAVWSPDGRTIAYSANGDGDDEVYLVAPDGSANRRLTRNQVEDLVQDWQPLHDRRAPAVRALHAVGRRGEAARLRYRIAETGPGAYISLFYDYETRTGGGGGSSYVVLHRIRPRHVYGFILSRSVIRNLPASIHFCVQAIDASLNESRSSCARFRIR
jgi:dipeptidyl aminopeptidase/acylaminoacyl peptidase